MGNQLDERVSGHYGWSGLREAIADELRGKGIDPERVTVAQLAPVVLTHAASEPSHPHRRRMLG